MGEPVTSQIETARSTAPRSAATGRLAAQSLRPPLPAASSCSQVNLISAPSSQWISVSIPCCPAVLTASTISSAWASKPLDVMNSFKLVCPASASTGISASAAWSYMTGCRTKSTAESAPADARSRSTACPGDWPGPGNDMLPIVVTPPAMAAAEPLAKSSAQAGAPGAGRSGDDRCTCMSIPPGSTSAPDASRYLRPRGAPPIWLITPPLMPTSHSAELPAVTTVPPRITRSQSGCVCPPASAVLTFDTIAAQQFNDRGARRMVVIRAEGDAIEGRAGVGEGLDDAGPVRTRIAGRPLAAADDRPDQGCTVPPLVACFDISASLEQQPGDVRASCVRGGVQRRSRVCSPAPRVGREAQVEHDPHRLDVAGLRGPDHRRRPLLRRQVAGKLTFGGPPVAAEARGQEAINVGGVIARAVLPQQFGDIDPPLADGQRVWR